MKAVFVALKGELYNFITLSINRVHQFYHMILDNIHKWVDTSLKTITNQFSSFKTIVIAAVVVVLLIDFFTKGSLGVFSFGLETVKDLFTSITLMGKGVIIAIVVGLIAYWYKDKK